MGNPDQVYMAGTADPTALLVPAVMPRVSVSALTVVQAVPVCVGRPSADGLAALPHQHSLAP